MHSLELWRNFICGNETGSLGRAVSLHLARSGSQSEHRILRILPARGACHIINMDSNDWSLFLDAKMLAFTDKTEINKTVFVILFFFLSTIADQSGIGMFFKTGVKNIMKSLQQNLCLFRGLAEHSACRLSRAGRCLIEKSINVGNLI